MSRLPADPTEMAISAKNITKVFKSNTQTVHALNGVSFEIPKSQVFTILGPNGAGKTTLLRILTTIMRPTSGEVFIYGLSLRDQSHQIRQKTGIVAQSTNFDKYLTVWQNLCLHAKLHRMNPAEYIDRINLLLDQVGLLHRKNDYMETFSGGMQRRVALVRALIHRPTLLFLDEPSTGLDPAARKAIWATIQEIKQETTVILTTHYMDEADKLSDEILIMNQGNVVMQGTATALKNHIASPHRYELKLNIPEATQYMPFFENKGFGVVQPDAYRLEISLDEEADLQNQQLRQVYDLISTHLSSDVFQSFGQTETDLETVYLKVADQSIPLQLA
ncbi:MAG: ABC transporter ATP-binding protein [Cyanobacteria bacterium P01_H01_bin.74]